MDSPLFSPAALVSLLDQHVTATFVLDQHGCVALWNKALEMLTGLDAASVIGKKTHWKAFFTAERPCLADLVLTDRIELVTELFSTFSNCTTSETAISVDAWCDLPLGGRRVYLTFVATPIYDQDWQIIGVMETVADNTRVMDVEAKLRGLAGIDGLTSLANRRAFDASLASEWRRATRANAPLSLLMVDIDHFKQYNDSFGHQGGDQCLVIVAQTLADSVCRVEDCPARYGGEEFAVILPNTDEAGVAIVAETIRANIEKRAIRHPLSSVGPHVTVSIGRATVIPKANDNLAKIISLADMALYQAKSLGRNRVCTSEERLPILERLNDQHPTP
jgi:diguanylate cyclase (GGDEF)-like protein/PAS domain S-box-containing protein